jgi:hypothetical protein
MAKKEIIINPIELLQYNKSRFSCLKKNKYETEEFTQKVIDKRFEEDGVKLRKYYCYNCESWHITKEINQKMHLLNNSGYWTNIKRLIDYHKNEYIFYTENNHEENIDVIITEGILLAYKKQHYPFICAIPEKREYRFTRQIHKPIVKVFNIGKEFIPLLQNKLNESIDINNKADFDEVQSLDFNIPGKKEIVEKNFNPVLKKEIHIVPKETKMKDPEIYIDIKNIKREILYNEYGTAYFQTSVKCIECGQDEIIDKRVPPKGSNKEQIIINNKLDNLTKPVPNSREWIHKSCVRDQKKIDGTSSNQAKEELEKRLNSNIKKEEVIIKNTPIVIPIEQEEIKKETIVVNTTVYRYELPFEMNTLIELKNHLDPHSNTNAEICKGMAYIFIKELLEKANKIPIEEIIQI